MCLLNKPSFCLGSCDECNATIIFETFLQNLKLFGNTLKIFLKLSWNRLKHLKTLLNTIETPINSFETSSKLLETFLKKNLKSEQHWDWAGPSSAQAGIWLKFSVYLVPLDLVWKNWFVEVCFVGLIEKIWFGVYLAQHIWFFKFQMIL